MNARNNGESGGNQWYLWVGGGIFVALVAIAIFLSSSAGGEPIMPGGYAASSTLGGAGGSAEGGLIAPYEPIVPQGTTISSSKNEAPASANPELDTKIRFFDLSATKDGFSPAELVVNQGDSLSVDLTAVDGDYDLDVPYLGAYFEAVKRGTTRRLPFDTSISGTFAFQCRDHCPVKGIISGRLIVLPRE